MFCFVRIEGGQLFDRVAKAKGMRLTEKQSAHVVKQLTECIQDLHLNGVCHRDLKPENVLKFNSLFLFYYLIVF